MVNIQCRMGKGSRLARSVLAGASDMTESFLSSQNHLIIFESCQSRVMTWSSRVTSIFKSLGDIGLQARVNVESDKISHFSYIFFIMKWHSKYCKMAPDQQKLAPNVVSSSLYPGCLI